MTLDCGGQEQKLGGGPGNGMGELGWQNDRLQNGKGGTGVAEWGLMAGGNRKNKRRHALDDGRENRGDRMRNGMGVTGVAKRGSVSVS